MTNYALAHPQIRWTLGIDGRTTLQTAGSGQMRDVLIELYGPEAARHLLPVADAAGAGEQAIQVAGFVSRPAVQRAARSSIHLFVNQRWVQPRGPLVAVLEEA